MRRDLNNRECSVSTALAADNFNPRNNTAGCFIMASGPQLPRAQRRRPGRGQVCLVPLSLKCFPDCEVFNK